ncbi:MAG: phosphoglycolate phosphatase [Xanthomonadales bacterium]|jgi:phosphoglycolate phosphatase|nr:phosphoglycolate phosphatase [Xanthomonadales bacterium]MDH3924147.1 phosphoglycolate phosphatase [Xanthomonadales bacterium]MDH3941579.1 phosphoglycolate phosphatase [Xanthomonadales bacterium]MDH4002425.1 phosphoglycolate phosphatase [Xanthomonadales bacterium]
MSRPEEKLNTGYPGAIVWDLDGTLVDSAPDLANALNSLLTEQGKHTHTVERVRPMIGAGVGKLIERGFRAAGEPLETAGIEALLPRFMELYTACATQQTALNEGARPVLEYFYNAGIAQGLCTNKPVEVTRLILNTLDISGFFGSVIGGDSTSQRKPHPLPLLTCIENLGVRPEDAVMIGDSGADVGSARSAGVPVILVPDGYTGVPAVSLGADYVVGSLAEIPGSIPPHAPLRQSA